MAENQYIGETEIVLEGKPYRLKFTWDAIARLQSELGDDFENIIGDASIKLNLPVIATALVIGLEHCHPGQFTEERIQSISPPIIATVESLNRALNRAFYGKEAAPSEPVNPGKAARILSRIISWIRKKPHFATG